MIHQDTGIVRHAAESLGGKLIDTGMSAGATAEREERDRERERQREINRWMSKMFSLPLDAVKDLRGSLVFLSWIL